MNVLINMSRQKLTIEGQYIWDLAFDYDNTNNTGDDVLVLEAFM